ncbi:MAG TPA: prephenate dehydrogenase/arogenate dehydrogenase family protein [Melioribacteraceae bacterium]|nr:prephenate dehydrogenase/arogenate dehydrogenase family protein [Melioribacteraceae bacterium]
MSINNFSVLGLGLIGASLAKAVKSAFPDSFITGYDLPEITSKALEYGIIDEKIDDIFASLNSQIIYLCLPVNLSIEVFKKLVPKLNKDQIISDVCSVKGVFQEIWDNSNSNGIYVGGHPMTGKEKGGIDNSDPLLFENSTYILTNTNNIILELLNKIGARVTILNPFLHDKVVAVVSHLPQLLSVNLVNFAANCNNEVNFIDFAAGGFRDMTRIASSDYRIWESIITNNKTNIINSIDLFIDKLNEIKADITINEHVKLNHEFNKARKHRDEIPKTSKGFLIPLHEIYVFVKDEPGVISKISTTLFSNGINIKDIELLKIREGTGGTFRLSFESETDAEKAQELMSSIGYITK